jgi:hypothetical protein
VLAWQPKDTQNYKENERVSEWLVLRYLLSQLQANHACPGLKGHLMRHFPAHWRLYQVLEKRDGPPTQEETDIARGAKPMDANAAKVYVEQLDQISNNIRDMLE